MYWNSNPPTTSQLETLLSKQDVTLQEIMDYEGVLQECKSQNKLLIDYLVRADILEKLVALTTEEPSGDEDEVVKYKYPNIACELLTSEVPQFSESLANDEALLRKLYSFLDGNTPLNPLLASFFSKTLSMLITRNSEQNWYSYQFTCLKVLEFLKLKENSINLLLKHLGTSAIMDLVFNLITKVEGSDVKDNIFNWLDEQKLVENLVALLDPSIDSDVHYNAAQLLCDVITTSRLDKISLQARGPNKILDRIESPEVVSLLLDFMLKEPKCETSIIGGISVLLTLLEDPCSISSQFTYEETILDNSDYLQVVANTTNAILPRLKDFHDILLNPPYKPAVKTTITVLDPPLGNTRVEVAKLLSVLVASNNESINKELAKLDTINVLLDLFFKYTWNNFLHTQVQMCLAFAINSESTTTSGGEVQKKGLIAHILSKCQLIQRILEAWQDNETQQTEHRRPRRGYMGHLINIADTIVQRSEANSFVALMKETVDNETLNKWDNFVSTKLAEIHKTYSTCFGGGHPSGNDKNGGEGKDGSFIDFSQQALAPTFTEGFGSYQEDEFNDNEDVLNSSANPSFQKINFKVNEEDGINKQQAVLFEKVCSQKFQTLDDYNFAWNQDSTSGKENDNDRDWQGFESSSSDEEEIEGNKENAPLDFNTLSEWPDCAGVPPAESLNPWGPSMTNTDSSPDLGWANFECAPVANFPDLPPSDINTTIATASPTETDAVQLEPTSDADDKKQLVDESEKKILLNFLKLPEIITAEKFREFLTEVGEGDVEAITKATDKVSLGSGDEDTKEEKPKPETEGADVQVNCVEGPEVIENLNIVGKVNEQNRRLSSQGLITNSETEHESGDYNHLPKENVQTVPKETAQPSSVEMGSSSEDKSTNGPI